jgi:urease subunit alpha
MFGSFGRAVEKCVTFVSQAALEDDAFKALQLKRRVEPVKNTRQVRKEHMIHNTARPLIEVDPETYAVRADGQLLVCDPAVSLPMTQRYFLF